MSRNIRAATDTMTGAGTVVNAPPLTMSLWFKPLGTVSQNCMAVAVTNTLANSYYLRINASGFVQAHERDGTDSSATTAVAVTPGVWNLITGVYNSHSSRSAFVHGTNKVTDATTRAVAATGRAAVGNDAAGTNGAFGLFAHAAVWSVALSDAEVLSLLTLPPSQVQPGALLEYWPLLNAGSPEPSYGSLATNLTVTGAVVNDDNPILFPYTDAVYARRVRSIAG